MLGAVGLGQGLLLAMLMALRAALRARPSLLLSALGSCGMASGFCSPAQLLPGSCFQSPEGSPAALQGRTRRSPQTPRKGAEAEPVGRGPEALLRSSPLVSSSAGPWGALLQHGWCRWWGVLGVWESVLRHRHCLEEIS